MTHNKMPNNQSHLFNLTLSTTTKQLLKQDQLTNKMIFDVALMVQLTMQTTSITKKEDNNNKEINLSSTNTDSKDDLSWAHKVCTQGMC